MTKNNFGIGEREIEFRAWIDGKMTYKDWIWERGQEIHERMRLDTMCLRIEREFERKKNDVVLMQYTGLKDKNGKKIFEGDILKGTYQEDTRMDVVECVNHGFFPFAEQTDYDGITYYDVVEYKIVGNVFENPELIPEK